MKFADIPTETFNLIMKDLRSQGWRKIEEYDGFDAWIDYGKVVLRKNGEQLVFEWDNWEEGRVEGTDSTIAEIGKTHGLKEAKQ